MPITAKTILHSTNSVGIELYTVQCRFHRYILSELATHRMFSKSTASSRAIPVAKQLEMIKSDPAIPIHFGKNQPGMQAHEEVDEETKQKALTLWLEAKDTVIRIAQSMSDLGVHKQVVNRLTEPHSYITALITATEWSNFFELRRHPDAQPEIHALADAIWDAKQASIPKLLRTGEWHMPYITEQEQASVPLDDLKKVSVARCARTSYYTTEGKISSIEEDIKLYERLVGSRPIHSNPAEHVATPDALVAFASGKNHTWFNSDLQGNFKGWCQLRKMIELNKSAKFCYFKD